MADTFNLVGVKRFDRRRESMNKMRNRMKGFYRVKSLNPARGTARTSFNSTPFFSGADENSMEGHSNKMALNKELERFILESEETDENKEVLKKLA